MDYLVSRPIRAIGVESFDPDWVELDDLKSAEFPTHRTFLPKGILVIENLTNLDQIPGARCYVIALEVRKAIIGLVQSKAQVEAARKAVELSGAALDAEQSRLTEGLAIPYDVIRRQRDYRSARFAEVQARSNYAKALVEMDRATGILQPPPEE